MDNWIIVGAVIILLFIFILCTCLCSENFSNLIELRRKVPSSARKLRAKPIVLDNSFNPNVDKIIAKDISMASETEPAEFFFELSERFHKGFNENEIERRNILRKLYSELNEPETVIMLFFCKKYFKFFKNWVISCEKAGIKVRDKTIAFALDSEAQKKSEDYGFKTFLIDEKYEKAGGAKKFGDREFAATMFYKNALIYDMLQIIPNNKFLLFQDSDLIWFRNPLPYLQNKAKQYQYDIQMMYDGPNKNYKNVYANSGFIFITSNDYSKALFETALRNSAYRFSGGSHQRPLEKIFEHYMLHNILHLKILDEKLFLNGHLFKLNGSVDKKLGDNWKEDAFCWHFSWAVDEEEKFKKLDMYGLNYIKDEL